jgi:Asp-tRNA(Asn)/Glu-tRNA(Gln) amidotransferase A subunit family amidase
MGQLQQSTRESTLTLPERRRQIAEDDRRLQAWVALADGFDIRPGPLEGVPFGVKDTYEVAGLPFECGSALYRGRVGKSDAGLVTRLKSLGAVVMGKTHTTAFAFFDPAPTRNPHNVSHTPGGSSSGSAAAVAAGMVPVALGSQTQGSVIRPASFCGVVGFKPTFGALPIDGLLPFAPSLDTPGMFTADAVDMLILCDALGFQEAYGRPLVAVPRSFAGVEPEMIAAVKDAVGRLGASGLQVVAEDFPDCFESLTAVVSTINQYEGARTFQTLWQQHCDRVGRKLAGLIEAGLQISYAEYVDCTLALEDARVEMNRFFAEFPFAITPAALGPAPAGLESTGDPVMNRPWTGLHTPAITVPMPVDGLPMGMQITAAPGQDRALLEIAVAAESAFALHSATL